MEEIELKLQLSDAAAAELKASGVLSGRPEPISQHSVYFDTPDRALSAAKLSLRIREAKGKRVQTVKLADEGAAGVHARPEWERQVEGDRPVLDGSNPVAEALAEKAALVAPIFEVSVTRETWTLDDGEARIEVVIDEGEVTAAERQSRFCECELELLSGSGEALFAAARRLSAVAPVKLGVQTKSERGYRLIGSQPLAFKADDVPLTRDMAAAEAFQRISISCLRQFRLNEDLLLATRSAEPLHQARVALRRLRSVISIFRPILATSDGDLRDELRWLAGTLGEVRDLDVLLSRAPAGQLHVRLREGREAGFDKVTGALGSDRARALMLDLAEWIAEGDWLSDPGTEAVRHMPAEDFAGEALGQLRRKVKRGGRNLSHLEDEARHELRKDAKKLRYATDFFSGLFKDDRPRRLPRFAAALGDLQDQLGALNDLSAAPMVLQRLGVADHPESEFLTPSGSKEALLMAAEQAFRKLAHAKKFWT